jgi:hypothetical protein
MIRSLGEIGMKTADGMAFRRITEEEGWVSAYDRAVALHEQTGLPVTISIYVEGILTPQVEITTRQGSLCIHCFRK